MEIYFVGLRGTLKQQILISSCFHLKTFSGEIPEMSHTVRATAGKIINKKGGKL